MLVLSSVCSSFSTRIGILWLFRLESPFFKWLLYSSRACRYSWFEQWSQMLLLPTIQVLVSISHLEVPLHASRCCYDLSPSSLSLVLELLKGMTATVRLALQSGRYHHCFCFDYMQKHSVLGL